MSQFTKQRKIRRMRTQAALVNATLAMYIAEDMAKDIYAKAVEYINDPVVSPEPNMKGVMGGNCNITACQAAEAEYYNKATKKYYCENCAEEINWVGGRAEVTTLYGTPLLCEIPDK